jgi:hypothetical protein
MIRPGRNYSHSSNHESTKSEKAKEHPLLSGIRHLDISGSSSVVLIPKTRKAGPPPRPGLRPARQSKSRVRLIYLFLVSYNSSPKVKPRQNPTMPPREECPNCNQMIENWHVEWYKTEAQSLYKGLAAMDCPSCGQPVGFRQGNIGPAPLGVPLVRRYMDKAAEWAVLGAAYAGGTLQGYISTAGAGSQYAHYWTAQEVRKADANEQSKTQGP